MEINRERMRMRGKTREECEEEKQQQIERGKRNINGWYKE